MTFQVSVMKLSCRYIQTKNIALFFFLQIIASLETELHAMRTIRFDWIAWASGVHIIYLQFLIDLLAVIERAKTKNKRRRQLLNRFNEIALNLCLGRKLKCCNHIIYIYLLSHTHTHTSNDIELVIYLFTYCYSTFQFSCNCFLYELKQVQLVPCEIQCSSAESHSIELFLY